MARGRRKRRRSKPQQRPVKASYRHGLKDAIGQWLPGPFFSHWPVPAGSKWSPQRLVWLALLMVWSTEQTLRKRFADARDTVRSLFPKWALGKCYTGWFEAQLKWRALLQPALGKRLRQQMQALAGRHERRQGWCAFAADGSRVECPRTEANEQELKCAGRKKTGPQLFVTTLDHMGLGVPWDFRIGPGTASERRHLEDMLPELPPQSLVVADAGFSGYDLYRRLLASGQHFLLRVGSNVHLLENLGYVKREGRDTVYLWPERNWNEPPVVLRLIRRSDGRQTMYLVTDVRDQQELSEKSAGILYEMRWGVEVFYRSLKQTLEKRRMLSRTPAAARSELTWALFGLWLLGLMTVAALVARGRDPLRWSAARARDRVRQSMRTALGRRKGDRGLSQDLARAVKDDYVRGGSKKARNWPHKKKEKPPGSPKIQSPTAEQRRAMQRLKAKEAGP
jgi:Transposase DDE domain